MFITKKNRLAIYSALFRDGLIVAPKNLIIAHPSIEGVPNLEVVKAMLSLKTRGFVRENFNWRHHTFYLTDEGIEYIRSYLHLPAEIVPATLKSKTVARPEGARRPEDGKEGTGGDFKPAFRREGGGYGGGDRGDRPPRRDFGSRQPRA